MPAQSLADNPPSPATADYLRRVRHLRAKYADRPARLYASLSQLSPRKPLTTDSTPAQHFAEQVRARLRTNGGLLPYSDRLSLLSEATRLQIGRFDANLIIAVVQHRTNASTPLQVVPAPRPSYTAPLCLALAVQLLLLAFVYLACSA